jgi:uncharacterized repeat protein (TIGR02543 family)
MSDSTTMRIRRKLSQLLAGTLIAPLFSFVPAVVVPTVLPSAQAVAVTAPCTTGSYALEVSGSGVVTSATNNSCVGALDLTGFGITDISAGFAFRNVNITNVYFPRTLTQISGYAAFYDISATGLSLPCSLTSHSGQMFQTDKSLLKSVQMCADGGTASQTYNMGYYSFGSNAGLVRFSFGATSASSVKVTTWNDSSNRTWGGAPSSLWIQYCGSDSGMTNHLVTPYVPTGTTVQCAQPSGTSYAPQPPTGVTSNSSALVSWTAPPDGGSTITGYTVTALPGRLTCTTTQTSCTVNGLANGTYRFVVVATNAIGASSPSIATNDVSVAAPTAPGAPTGVSGTVANASSVVSWTAPGSNGGSAITGYTVTSSPAVTAPATCTNTTNLSCTFTGLTNGTTYTFSVRATNAVGTSSAGTSSNVIPRTVPGAPTGVSGTAANASSVVSWTAPGSNGGSAITGYTVTSSPGGFNCTTPSTSCTVSGLTNGTDYTFTVVATNAAGSSTASTASASVTPRTLPGAPTGVSGTVANASSVVSWTAPGSTGGSAITGYTVTSSPGGFTCTTASTSCTVSGLTNGTAYTFTVVATNAAGSSTASTASASVTPRTLPGAPTGVSGTAANASSVVSWTAPGSNGGSAITGYTVTSSPGGFNCTTATTSCTVSGLTSGTAYTFTVVATNAAGSSTASTASASVTTLSDVATLSAASIKGQTSTLGTPNAVLASATPGAITLTTAQAAGTDTTTFTKTDAGATITRIVKYAFGASTSNFETDEAFANDATTTVSTGDFFIVKVTAADATVRYYRIDVTVNSNISTLSGATTIKGQTPTLGTPSATLGSETPGTITLTTAQAASTSLTSTVTKTDSGAITKIVKYLSGATSDSTNFDAATDLTSGTTTTVSNGDYFIVKVIAADGSTVNYYRINVTVNSDVATLSGATIKGQTPTLGTPNAALASVTPGAITLTTAQAAGTDTTTFTKTDAGATITRIVKYAFGASTSNFDSDTAFNNGAASTVINNDFFIIKVTAADATVRYYRINVTVNSNVATLSTATTIKGQTPTLGTPSATLGSETPGAITLTTAQATGAATTTFIATDAGATISRIVKYVFGASTSNFDTATALANIATTTVTNGDFFIVKVTAADATVNFYRFNLTVNSDVATLSGATIKGQTPTLGTPNAVLTSATPGAITLTTAQAASTDTTTFTKSDAGATISRIVKYASGASTSNFNSDTAFNNGATTTVANSDFFIIKVTAADGTVSFYRVNVSVNSNVATLSAASVKGINATTGTAGTSLGSLSAGTVTLSLSQASGTAVTTFTATDAGATITKIAKIASGTAENSTNFNAAAAFTNSSAGTVSNGDYFIIQITAADGTVNYSRVTVVFATNPTVPLSLSATAQAGGANLTWNAPTGNGGSALTGYVIEASTDSATWASVGTTNDSTRQLSVTSLLNGTAYVYRVRATNSSGDLNYNWATSASVRSFYFVECSTSGSFYVNSTLSVVQIPSAAGVNCQGEVTIPQGIVQINSNAFTANTETANLLVTKVNFPATGLRTIDQGAFKNLGLTSVSIPATVETVGIYSFMNNPITTVYVAGTGTGYHATALLDSAFKCVPLVCPSNPGIALTLGSGKIQIGENFGTGTVFSSVDWGTGITSIGRKAFYNVAAGSWAPLFPRTITQIDAQAFEGTGIKTIRFGTATTHSFTSSNSIAPTAFDTSITSVQYCGSTGTYLSNYINSRFTSKTIWCVEDVPNAPINLTAVAGTSGQIVLNWGKGATRVGVEAPTDGFEIRYSSDGGSTWSALIQAAANATSITVSNLTNATNYVFQIRAKNLFGNSAYSVNASGTPLGTQVNPTFGPSTSTVDGFTVNITNYDATYTYGVPQFTVGSGTISVGTATGSNLLITVTGMSPGSLATFSIGNQKTGFSSGTGLASGSALNAAKVPVIGSTVALTSGFTAAVTNYDSAYQWFVSSTVGTAVINTQGGITVSGVNPSTAVELTVSTTRVGYAPGSTKVTVTTLALLKVFYSGTRSTGGAAPTDANSYASNASAVVLANPATGGLTLNGYDFSGWSLNSDESGQLLQPSASLQLGLVDITLYAKWTLKPYTVTYNANGATGGSAPLDSNTYTMGGSVPISGNTGTLVRTGYSFIGWGISSTDTVNLYVSGNTFTVGTNNIVFWARWSPNTYRVTFDANGGSGAPSKAYDDYTTAGNAITLATIGTMQKTGYNFIGWGLSAVSTPVADPFTTTSNLDLYAQWTIANYAVTYQAGTYGSGTVPTQANVNYGSNFTAAASTGLSGSDGTNTFAFVSWSDGTRTYAPGQSILMGAGAVTLTAQWTRIYNVKYSFNGGSVATPIADQQKIAGDTIVVSSTVPTRAGYNFVTWKDQSGEEATAGANYSVRDGHYLLYAQWTPQSYTITYDVNGGNTSPIQVNQTIGQIFTVAAAPTKVGHDFEYWSDGTNNYNAGSDYQVGTSNVVLQAIWTPQVYQISYSFNGGTGTPISPQNYTYGTGPATLPASGPTRSEYNFTGWATTNTATSPVSASFAPSGNILLHAVWITSVYRLSFNAGIGISDTATATVTIGQSLSLPSATRTNYTLQGWSIAQTGGTLLLTTSPYTPTADAILYAQWAPAVFTVTYNGNSGTAGKASDSMVYNAQTPIVLPSASRTNYVFSGWYSQATGGYLIGDSGSNYSPTGSVTAYARWVQASLSGMGAATLIAQITVRDGFDSGFNAGTNGSTATVSYTAGALPDGTVISAYLENSPARVTSLLQTAASPVLSLIIAWVAPDGTVPDTAPGKPIIMTITNSSITAGSKIFGLVGNQPELLGIALINGQVQVSITRDPAVVVAMVSPDAPTGVTATPIDSTSATISWVAPASNGGSAITKYTATAGAGKSCESATTSCVISGLVAGTPYTFTVIATNAIGDSAATSPSSPITLNAPPSVNIGGGSSGGAGGGGGNISIPVIDPRALAEKAAEEAKAAAEIKAAQEKAAAEEAAAAAIKAAQEIADAQARAAAEIKAAQDRAAEEARIADELKAAQEKADAELKAAAEKKALDDAKEAAALAAKKIIPQVTLYSISSKLSLSAYDNAYLKKYISTLKSKAPVTCIGYYYTKNTTVSKAKALATTQAKAVCSMIKKAKPSVITKIAIYPSTKAPLAAQGAKWVAVSYRVDSFKN